MDPPLLFLCFVSRDPVSAVLHSGTFISQRDRIIRRTQKSSVFFSFFVWFDCHRMFDCHEVQDMTKILGELNDDIGVPCIVQWSPSWCHLSCLLCRRSCSLILWCSGTLPISQLIVVVPPWTSFSQRQLSWFQLLFTCTVAPCLLLTTCCVPVISTVHRPLCLPTQPLTLVAPCTGLVDCGRLLSSQSLCVAPVHFSPRSMPTYFPARASTLSLQVPHPKPPR